MSRRVSRDPAVSPVLLSSNSRLARVGPSSRSAAEYSCECKGQDQLSCCAQASRAGGLQHSKFVSCYAHAMHMRLTAIVRASIPMSPQAAARHSRAAR